MTGKAEVSGSGRAANQWATPTGGRRPRARKQGGAKTASLCGGGRSGRSGSVKAAEATALCVQSRPESESVLRYHSPTHTHTQPPRHCVVSVGLKEDGQ